MLRLVVPFTTIRASWISNSEHMSRTNQRTFCIISSGSPSWRPNWPHTVCFVQSSRDHSHLQLLFVEGSYDIDTVKQPLVIQNRRYPKRKPDTFNIKFDLNRYPQHRLLNIGLPVNSILISVNSVSLHFDDLI